ncbi:MAG TPA: type II secretion system protein [Verrucomicrobiae bacterium]|nr:type II secretion system protein [Verrucomicrobiae bacterium]
MKTTTTKDPSGLKLRCARAGFSLLEMVLVAGIFAILVTWMVSSQLYGMRVYTIAETKLVATAGARQVISSLRDQIREANSVYVGNCSSSWKTYADVTNGLMQGNALEIYPTASTNPFLICYLDSTTGTNRLMLYNSGLGMTNDLCDYITNQLVFDAEDAYGNILTSNVDNRVIGITMQLSQWEYPIARMGNTNFNYYNFYQLRTRATRRAIN